MGNNLMRTLYLVTLCAVLAVATATIEPHPTLPGCFVDSDSPWKGPSCPENRCSASTCSGLLRLAENQALILATPPHASSSEELPGFGDYERVVVFGIDGLSGYWLEPERRPTHLSTPNMDYLKQTGAWTSHARSQMRTVSMPNWASIVMGAGPEETGVLTNDYLVGTEWEPLTGNFTLFPSMFEVAKHSRKDLKTGLYNDWGAFLNVFPEGVFDYVYTAAEDHQGTPCVQRMIEEAILPGNTHLTMARFDDVDGTGHEYGWGTPEYYAAVETADALLGDVMNAIHLSGNEDETLLIVTSDHGGETWKLHGETDQECMYTPLMLKGKSTRPGYHMPCPTPSQSCFDKNSPGQNIRNLDVASTVLHALGIQQPALWIGRPLTEGFEENQAFTQ